jgi:hypothetical protein
MSGYGVLICLMVFSLHRVETVHAASAPTVVSVVIATTANGQTDSFPGGSIDLIAGSTRTVYVNGVVEDLDGKATISSVSGKLHRSGVQDGNNCSADTANCYVVGNCALGDNADPNQKTFSCRMNLLNIAQSTVSGGQFPNENWVAYVSVTDGVETGTHNATTKEMQSILSLTIPSTIAYGNRDLGAQSTVENNVEMVLTQRGNVEADVEVSMTATGMACASGTIPRGNVKWALTDVAYSHGSNAALTATPVDTNVYVGYGTHSAPTPTKTLYWNIQIPIEGVGGYCSSSVNVSSIAR